MNKKAKKLISSVCTVIMLTTLTACSGKEKPKEVTNKNNNQPVKVKLLVSDGSQPIPDGGFASSPDHKYILDKVGIDLNIDFLAHGQYDDLLRLKLASQDSMDAFMDWGVGSTFVANNQATDLTQAINKYGTEIKKVMTKATMESVTNKGKVLGIPSAPWSNTGSVMYIRKDWLDNLNIKVPKTSEELLTVLRSFRDNDPNKNGKKDEIPLTLRENVSWGENIYGMWGTNSNGISEWKGEMLPGCLIPNIKQGLGFFRTAYSEKLLDQDFLLNKRDQWTQKIISGQVGVWCHVPELASDWQDKLMKSIPNEKPEVIAIPTPKGTGWDGPTGFYKSTAGSVWVVPKESKNAEAVVKLANWLVSDEGYKYAALGVPGQTYTEVDGKITYDKEKDKANTWRPFVFKLLKFKENVDGVSMTKESLEVQKAAFKVSLNEGLAPNPQMEPLKDSGLYNDLRGPKWAQIASEIIVGKKSLDDYDKWAEEIKKGPAKSVIDELAEQYKEYIKQK